MRVVLKLALVCVLLVNLTGCGYALTGRGSAMPAYIRTVGIPLFSNVTPVYDIEQKVTERVRLEMISRGKYQVNPDATGMDATLIGEITSISLTPTSFNSEQLASRYAFSMVIKVTFTDNKTQKVLYENPALSFREEYEVSTGSVASDPSSFLGQDTQAVERIANDFARTVVASILEAF
jgi:hypothetical protein